MSLAAALYTGWHLKQGLDAQHELRSQMGDLSLANMTDTQAPTGAVSLGEASLRGALAEVHKTTQHDEIVLAVEGLGILAGLLLLRRRGDEGGSPNS